MSFKLACFITSHGFGHASRCSAVLNAILYSDPQAEFEIYTQVPEWFFKDSLCTRYQYHSLQTDVGLVQSSPTRENLPETLKALAAFFPLNETLVTRLAGEVSASGCQAVLCDISPLGIEVAARAGLPSILEENFTWDWIYQGYAGRYPALKPYIHYLSEVFSHATRRVQTAPVCQKLPADMHTLPVSRASRKPADETRARLGIPEGAPAVMITMGGIPPTEYNFIDRLQALREVFFVIPGASAAVQQQGNLILLPHHSQFFHPDLVNACQAVIGKLGYSTLSEVFHAGVPFGYVTRPAFRESEILAAYVDANMPSVRLEEEQFNRGEWIERLPALLSLPRRSGGEPNGADHLAAFILNLVESARHFPLN